VSLERGTVALIGDPVTHSVSPAMQRAAFRHLGLGLEYEAIRVPATNLPSVFPELRLRTVGLNVTAPLKEAVLALLDRVDPLAAAIRSANTVSFSEGIAWGTSTDGPGFSAALSEVVAGSIGSALVLGAGGAARAVAAEMLRSGTRVVLAARSAERGAAAVEVLREAMGSTEVELRTVPWDRATLEPEVGVADLLVNATPLGGPEAPRSPLPDGVELHSGQVVFDLVSRPRRTPLLLHAAEHGCCVVEGVEMLVHQGVASLREWTGLDAPVDVMRRAALEALERRVPAGAV
jgi:shikimate dehydrogenase